MKQTSGITRMLAFFISVVMIVSLMPLDIIAETIDTEDPGIIDFVTPREEETGSEEIPDSGDYTPSDEDVGAAEQSEGSDKATDAAAEEVAEATESSDAVSSEENTASESSDNSEVPASSENTDLPAADDSTGDTSANEDVSSDEPAEGAEADAVVTDNITLYSSYSNVTLKGELPVDGSVTAEKHIDAASVEKNFIKGLKNLFGIRSSDPAGADLASYDITIYDGNNTLWQPEEGKKVEVTIYDESFESVPFVNVYHECEN
jgi:hypothetical protein